MGRVKIPYYAVKNGRGFWQPTPAMREAGFEPVACGPDGPEAWQRAAECNARWKEYAAVKAPPIIPLMPVGSLAEAFQRYRGTAEWSTKAPRTREEWERAWLHIGRVFGDVRPRTVMLEHISGFREIVERDVSRREPTVGNFRHLLAQRAKKSLSYILRVFHVSNASRANINTSPWLSLTRWAGVRLRTSTGESEESHATAMTAARPQYWARQAPLASKAASR
jgi:hypothetical protein